MIYLSIYKETQSLMHVQYRTNTKRFARVFRNCLLFAKKLLLLFKNVSSFLWHAHGATVIFLRKLINSKFPFVHLWFYSWTSYCSVAIYFRRWSQINRMEFFFFVRSIITFIQHVWIFPRTKTGIQESRRRTKSFASEFITISRSIWRLGDG